MAVSLTTTQIEVLVKARQDSHLTQLELSNQSRVALRTIKDLEARRRTSFNESTLISLCRELKVNYQELMGNGAPAAGKKRIKGKGLWVAGLVLPLVLILLYLRLPNTGGKEPVYQRNDYIPPEKKMTTHPYNPVWGEDENGTHVNYCHLNQSPYPGEKIEVEVKWSYHFVEGSTPRFYISAYTEWEPDREIPLLTQTLSGEGSKIFNFQAKSPQVYGDYRIRVFFASAFGPFSSFYGHAGTSQLESPTCDNYLEIPLEVIPK
jgi:transcriptional regulator with XRE-family HTH domain